MGYQWGNNFTYVSVEYVLQLVEGKADAVVCDPPWGKL